MPLWAFSELPAEVNLELIETISSGDERWVIQKSEIDSHSKTPYSMPPIGEVLSRRELRDLVEFMTTLGGSE